MLRRAIDAEKLIEDVRKRPALYDGKPSDPNVRKTHWEEIGKNTFPEVWETATVIEKDALVKEVQMKWKCLRDSYTRVKKQEKEDQLKGAQKIRKKYMFYDQLLFLDIGNRRAPSPNTIFLQDHEEGMDSSLSLEPEMLEANTSTAVKDLVGDQREIENHLTEILKELVKIQKEDRTDDRMGNKKFLLSLLPFMEKLPDDVNLEVRLQLMSILQTYSNGESFLKA